MCRRALGCEWGINTGQGASRGTETSAEVLVGPPWRMESNAGQQQWYEVSGRSLTDGGPKEKGPLRPATAPPPPPPSSASTLFGVGRHRERTWVTLDEGYCGPLLINYLCQKLQETG